ncbi:stress response translation initiation inhibitor YciH [Alcaligenes endophyticus]|uniref:Stress response translation initiation inhibitor YciH n=1 Tax=Alcaligenes endophyticus TaxID=1929088 RepID=A0ABT8EHX1_9BURK|nr:stress response translation initiation inhibitor YciH [Alcaligenes endophyticus]MCX5592696.1 stress response translation initiation inhibitor YciH [Alcaligenes endophyticus]MDN4120884.1 stress response translation initiation inhibitor YciH [Alcaligenes endophyticus]
MKKSRSLADQLSGLVYSTELGSTCPNCRQALEACTCQAVAAKPPPSDGRAWVRYETKGRKGKGVTTVQGLQVTAEQLAELAKTLKNYCGSGGTVKGWIIEIQGEHGDKILAKLRQLGFKTR